MDPYIVGITGRARSGKDTIAAILVEDYGFTRVAFADKLKELALQANPLMHSPFGTIPLQTLVRTVGWEDAKQNDGVRAFLQNLGVAAREVLDPNVWVDAALETAAQSGRDLIVIADVRFPNEIDACDFVIHVHRPDAPGALTGAAASHASEQDLSDSADTFILNSGTLEDLGGAVASIMTYVGDSLYEGMSPTPEEDAVELELEYDESRVILADLHRAGQRTYDY